MTKFRRLTALLLVLLLAASACSETTNTDEPAAEETVPENEVDVRKAIPDDLPEKEEKRP